MVVSTVGWRESDTRSSRALVWHDSCRRSRDMPIYVYECPTCSHRFEAIKLDPTGDDSWAVCPECKAAATKIPTASSIHFKGKDWTPRFHGPGRDKTEDR